MSCSNFYWIITFKHNLEQDICIQYFQQLPGQRFRCSSRGKLSKVKIYSYEQRKADSVSVRQDNDAVKNFVSRHF